MCRALKGDRAISGIIDRISGAAIAPKESTGWLDLLRRFVVLQVNSAVFGIGILALLLLTWAVWQPDWWLYRYDFLFICVMVIQGALLWSGRETWQEAKVIFAFHIVGVVMEIFKTQIGSWVYPGASVLALGGVPLFTGFMYSAVGSYIARFWRLSGMRLENAPPWPLAVLLAVAIYANFFTHHFIMDFRWLLFIAIFALYGLCFARFPGLSRRVPLLGFFVMAAVLIYGAENIGSITGTWLYPAQMDGWQPVHPAKIGAWLLLMIVSFTLVQSVQRRD